MSRRYVVLCAQHVKLVSHYYNVMLESGLGVSSCSRSGLCWLLYPEALRFIHVSLVIKHTTCRYLSFITISLNAS